MTEPDVDAWAAAAVEAVRTGCAQHDLPLPELII
jgi:hypothetical protein